MNEFTPLRINQMLKRKYLAHDYLQNQQIIDDIVFNEKTSFVALFKDYLISDDLNDFFKESYSIDEIKFRMPKILEFYSKFSTIFPNYSILEQADYMFKNIERKQRTINERHLNQKLHNEKITSKNHEHRESYTSGIYIWFNV